MKSVVFRRLIRISGCLAAAALLGGCASQGPVVAGDVRNQVIISVRDQKLTVITPDHRRIVFPISTSKFGLGDRRRSYSTPTGELEVAQKVGDGAPVGSVFHGRVRTGEIVKVDAPGRDAIVTRILALRGLEEGNKDAFSRGIYIHGTPEERNIGRPTSYGCIRMRSKDVIQLYNLVKVGARVQIIDTTAGRALAENIIKTPPPSAEAPTPTAPPAENATEVPQPKPAAIAAAKPKPAAEAEPAVPASKLAANTKKEWAGSPSRMLARQAETDAKTKKAKSLGSAQAISNNSTDRDSNGPDLHRSAMDSL
jgi:hypothetical protein